jgi:integrase
MFNLAWTLMKRAEAELSSPLSRRAVLFRDGLMIAIICVWAPRARNIAETMIGTNLQRRGETWWADFAPHETKNKRPIEIPLPGLAGSIERYLEYYRPHLLNRSYSAAAGNALWIGCGGRPLTTKGVRIAVTRVTKRELGRSINPHLFRKIIPTELAIRDPEHVGVAQPLLGHSDYRMTQKAYNLGRAIDAASRHQALIRSIRDGSAAGTRSTNRKRNVIRKPRRSSPKRKP